MNYRDRTFPRSRSFDPSCTRTRHHLQEFRQANVDDEGALLDMTSTLILQESSTPNRFDSMQYRNPKVMSPLSPLSDRSIEAMSVSDISNSGDMELMDVNEEGNTSMIHPFGKVKVADDIVTGDQPMVGKNMRETGLWSNILKHLPQSEADSDVRSVMSEQSAHSAVSCASCGSDNTVVSQQTTISRGSIASSNLPASLYEQDFSGDSDSSKGKSVKSMRHATKAEIKQGHSWKYCLSILNLLAIFAILAAMIIFSCKDVHFRLCSSPSNFNLTGLAADLEENVFGQHIATQTVIDSLSNLISDPDKNSTVLSFHGWTGIGKNFVSGFVAKHLREEDVHKIIVPLEFAHGGQSAENHKERMFKRIIENIPHCGLVLFIVDEVDKASEAAVSGLHEALLNLSSSHNLEQVKVLILLLSNSGGSAINRYFLDQLLKEHDRESVNRQEVVNFMLKIDSAQISHEWFVPLYEDSLIDAIVPFLPLEKSHTVLCIKRYIAETRPLIGSSDMEHIADRVLEQMAFFPQGLELFSSTGCRGIALKVDMTID